MSIFTMLMWPFDLCSVESHSLASLRLQTLRGGGHQNIREHGTAKGEPNSWEAETFLRDASLQYKTELVDPIPLNTTLGTL